MLNKYGFTLVEMVVGITISMLLMVGVTSLVGGGMQNIIGQQKVLKDQSFTVDSFQYFQESFAGLDKKFSQELTGFGILFKRKKDFQNIGFSYLGTKTMSGYFCPSDSDSPETDHVYLQNILPFEEIGEDIFLQASDSNTSKIVNNLYTDKLNHSVKNSSDDSIIIGKGYFGNQGKNGDPASLFYLNNPTGLAHGNSTTYISDTGNNRILAFSGGNVQVLLDSTDGISEPTGLDFENDTLYIANSGKGEILAFHSQTIPHAPDAEIKFTAESDISNFTNIKFSFSNISSLSNTNNSTDYSFPSGWKSTDFLEKSANSYRYYFSDLSLESSAYEATQCNPSNNRIIIENGSPKKYEYSSCSASGTGTVNIYSGDNPQNIITGNTYDFSIQNIPDDFSAEGNYYIELQFLNKNTEVGKIFVPYFTQGNNNLSDYSFNSLKVIKKHLNYPTGIEVTGNNIKYNEFLKREEKVYNIQTKSLSTTKSLSVFSDENFKKIPIDDYSDFVLKLPLKELNIKVIDHLFHGTIKYFRIYNCYNPDENSVRTFLIKKFLQ